jgi:hypothetical protein
MSQCRENRNGLFPTQPSGTRYSSLHQPSLVLDVERHGYPKSKPAMRYLGENRETRSSPTTHGRFPNARVNNDPHRCACKTIDAPLSTQNPTPKTAGPMEPSVVLVATRPNGRPTENIHCVPTLNHAASPNRQSTIRNSLSIHVQTGCIASPFAETLLFAQILSELWSRPDLGPVSGARSPRLQFIHSCDFPCFANNRIGYP